MLYNVDAPGEWGNMQAAAQVQAVTETLAMADGCKLFLRIWRVESRDVLLLVHGLGAHSGWFVDMANELAARGLNVYAVDHRGFGRSEGLPGHVERAENYISDLAALVTEIRSRHTSEGAPARIFALGHSMGGIFVTCLAARQGSLLDGVIFLNPWVRDSAKISLNMALGVFGGGLVRSQRRWRNPGGTEGMTTNPEAIDMLEADPYWRRDLTANFWLEILRLRLQVLKLAPRVTLPALVLQVEKDRSVIPGASRKLYEVLSSGDKTWKLYPDYAHDAELEADRTQLDQDIVEWIQARS
ncbi:MAG TPA: alpha/beta hydrolase [Ktedonobacteraceae bacterium]